MYLTEYMGKSTGTFGRLKFQLLQNQLLQAKFVLQVRRARRIELLMLVSEVMVIYRLKILNGISMKFIECLNEDV